MKYKPWTVACFGVLVLLVGSGCATVARPTATLMPGDDPAWGSECQARATVGYASGDTALGGAAVGAGTGALIGGAARGWGGAGTGAGIGAGAGFLFGLIGEAIKQNQVQQYSQDVYEECMAIKRRQSRQIPPPPPPGYQPQSGYPPPPSPQAPPCRGTGKYVRTPQGMVEICE